MIDVVLLFGYQMSDTLKLFIKIRVREFHGERICKKI